MALINPVEIATRGYDGHVFIETPYVARDIGNAPGWFIWARNGEKYGRFPDARGAYVKLIAWPIVKTRRRPNWNGPVRAGWKTRKEALAALASIQDLIV
jgi:hypothetical protein